MNQTNAQHNHEEALGGAVKQTAYYIQAALGSVIDAIAASHLTGDDRQLFELCHVQLTQAKNRLAEHSNETDRDWVVTEPIPIPDSQNRLISIDRLGRATDDAQTPCTYARGTFSGCDQTATHRVRFDRRDGIPAANVLCAEQAIRRICDFMPGGAGR